MATVYVVHSESNRDFVEQTLLPPLPSLGFDRWASAVHLGLANGALTVPCAFHTRDVIVVVVSRAVAESTPLVDLVARGMKLTRAVIPVLIDDSPLECFGPDMSSLPRIDLARREPDSKDTIDDRLCRGLAELLPDLDDASGTEGVFWASQRIPWVDEVFSRFLQEAIGRHDFNRAERLIAAFARHAGQRESPYPIDSARTDLSTLRRKRQFSLMRRYAEIALASGTRDLQVRRQYGQALIEQGQFDRALQILSDVVHDSDSTNEEWFEARGLIGRAYKQQYVDHRENAAAPELLRRAIEEYEATYNEDRSRLWQGINTASLLLSAHRHNLAWGDARRARTIAVDILERIEERQSKNEGYVWDLATRVEAYVALGEYAKATDALQSYVTHSDMDAFEVSSTYRQFSEVLELGEDPSGRPLLDQLWQAVERYRTGGASSGKAGSEATRAGALLPMLVRVSDPDWQPRGIPDLVVCSRLGTIVSIQGSTATMQALVKDPLVIAVEESRPAAMPECIRSVPFIRVRPEYGMAGATFAEKGDQALIAVIDDGIDVLHGAFADANGGCRVVAIWDQTDATGSPPAGFTYGTYHIEQVIAAYVAQQCVPVNLGRNPDGHGTHVASIAAGRAVGAFAGGVAPEALLVVVISRSGESIGYSTSHVDALAFIDRVATERGQPVVVNVSQGMNAGAHDGRSALEVAFDEFSKGGRKPGRVVVKSAGNERDKNGHAVLSMRSNSRALLPWRRYSDPFWPRDRLEVWWSSANDLKFRLHSPARTSSEWVSEANPDVSGRLAGGAAFRLQFTKRHVDNGDNQLRVDLGDAVTGVAEGEWVLEMVSGAVPVQEDIHVWLERGGQYPSEFTRFMSDRVTLSIPATAQNVIAVGAVEADDPIEVSRFSSHGPTRDGRFKPEVCAPGVAVQAARAETLDEIIERDGTSMAAPHVAGAIALVLSRAARLGRPWPTATQVTSALRQKTCNYNGQYDYGQGYGVVDVAALLEAL